jgi:hypothetical protein
MKISNAFSHTIFMLLLLLLSGCGSTSMPKLFWSNDDMGTSTSAHAKVEAEVRPVLDVPPSLRGEVQVPDAHAIAVQSKVPERYKKIVAGKKVALDARQYDAPVAKVFSAVIDAMTALNLPVESIDSASGSITTDWIRVGADSTSTLSTFNVFGESKIYATRYRYVVRVLRETLKDKEVTRLEVRSLTQVFQNRHWTNKKLRRKYVNDLFSRVEENIQAAQ